MLNRNKSFESLIPISLMIVGFVLIIVLLAGCSALDKIPDGMQMQSSTFGLKFAPQALDGTPLVLGSHSTIITTAQPPDAGVNLNRFEAKAPYTHIKSTVASGNIGEQISAAGGPAALKHLLGNDIELGVPVPLPRTDQQE